ncbi:MAG: hypothetical protein K2Y39_17345 [Candidatus Obscuribacterales bacterium]|nr:hypothetical protein [Candidatus Obscuribacterales bacterium]
MLQTILACLLLVIAIAAAIVVVVARAITPLGRGTLNLEDSFGGPPEAAPAYAELQRLELQYALAEELGSLDAGSLETLRQDVVAARTRYESALQQSTVKVEVSIAQQQQQQLDMEAAVSDCLSPSPSMQPAPAMGIASAAFPLATGRKKKF